MDLLAVQGTLKSLLQNHSSKASIIWCSAFFIAQLSHLYMTIGKNIALNRWSRNTWSNRQIWPWSTEFSRAKAYRDLPRECTGHSKHPFPTTQEMTLQTDISDSQNQNQLDFILCSQRWRSSISSAKTRPGADRCSDYGVD